MKPRVVKEFLLYLSISILVIVVLTAAAGKAASRLPQDTTESLRSWIKQSPANRFDDWMDGVVIANILYKSIDAEHSLWTYFGPSCAPPAGWELLEYVLSPKNHDSLSDSVKNRKGGFLHRYWTGHIVLTSLALYIYGDPGIASKAAMGCVLFSMLVYVIAWKKRLGFGGAAIVAAMLLGSGTLYIESFHTHAWGLAVAFLTAAYVARQLETGRSYIPPAVVGAVFANWVGYDYVFPTLAFSLPLFLHRKQAEIDIVDLSVPLKFVLTFLSVTGIMMILRIPIAYFFENCPPSEFLSQLTERLSYRLQGGDFPQEVSQGVEVSRKLAIMSALPAVNTYLFNLGGRFIPLIGSIISYVAYQALPVMIFTGILIFKNRARQMQALRTALVIACSVLLFHLMLILLVNHACVHPWMHARYMIFSLVLSWGAVISALGRSGTANEIQ